MRALRMLLVWLGLAGILAGEDRTTGDPVLERLARIEGILETLTQQIDKRFEQVDKRFEEFRMDMNARFAQVDKRFEQIERQFDRMMTFMWILAAIFTAMVTVVIGWAYWDRRTIIRRAKEETMDHLEREGVIRDLQNILSALREAAKSDRVLAEALRKHHLL